MMSHYECIVPEIEWNLSHQTQTQRQEQAAEGLEEKQRERERNYHLHQHQDHHNSSRSSHHSHMHSFHQSLHAAPATSNDVHQIEELTWEKGQLAMHGHGEQIVAAAAPKPIWSSSDTLESIVNQTSSSSHNKTTQYGINPRHDEPALANKLKPSSSQKTATDRTSHPAGTTLMMKKRMRSESELCETHNNNNGSSYSKGDSHHHHHRCHRGMEMSMCGSASATFCREEDTTMMTWASFESPGRLKTSKTTDEDSASLDVPENQDEDCKIKAEEGGRSHSSRRSRGAANHNQSERRRRDRINQKMKALQMLVPNAHKTDKASMLDEVIEYLKYLQAQVNTMMNMRNMNIPQMAMIAQAQQQQLQMSLLSRMAGMGVEIGMGMGMIDVNSLARAAAAAAQSQPLIHPASSAAAAANATFFPPQFLVAPPPHSVTATHSSVQEELGAGSNGSSLPILDPYCSFLAQNTNIDLYNKMAAVYRQQNIDMASPSKIDRVGRQQ